LDTGVSHYAKVILDELFGQNAFQNEIVWKRSSAHSDSKQGMSQYGRVTDTIFFYTKGSTWTWNQQFQPYTDEYVAAKYAYAEPEGRRFKSTDLTAAKPGGDTEYEWKGKRPPTGRYWAYSKANMEKMEAEGRIHYTTNGFPRLKHYLDEMAGIPLQDYWLDIPPINSQAIERLGYPTQKPEALLERILKTSSDENALVLDCFCGAGTTAAVAEKLKRRWIACDLSRFAIHTTRKRLLSIPDIRPFVVQNLGKYERQMWAGTEFGQDTGKRAAARQRAYIDFILKLAGATPLNGYAWLHGIKRGRMVHVGAVDAPVSVGDITQIAAEFKRAVGTGKDAPTTNGVDVLGWDFAFELNEIAKQQAAAANIQMRFLRIPRDVMDKRAVEQGDIHFFELAALSVEVKTDKRNVSIKLKDFIIPPDDVPEDARRAVKHWSQWIDYWAADWDNRGDTFHNEWQTYRTRKDAKLALETAHSYPDAGEYTVVVKVIDILGNDTTKTLKVKVK
jgi:SAM-dependent methyltransferase